jgi:hypothetical protein
MRVQQKPGEPIHETSRIGAIPVQIEDVHELAHQGLKERSGDSKGCR